MAIKSVPFVPFPLNRAIDYARSMGLVGAGNNVAKISPQLTLYLYQSDADIDAREYASVAVFAGVFWTLTIFGIFIFLSFISPIALPQNFLLIGAGAAGGVGFVSFIHVLMYPRVLVNKKVRELDKNLLFALRHLLIQAKSGITLFDSMVSVSKAGYGMVSQEFNEAVRKISTGVRDVTAFEDLALKNPSIYFRRAMWQITNALRAGSDISNTLESIISHLSNEQRIMVRKYGSQLNPLAFLYMMFGIIIPTLGITLLISLSSFTGLPIEQYYFWGILAFLIFFNFNFLGMVKSKRPSVEVYE